MVPERSFKASQLKVHSSSIEQSRSIVKPTTLRARAGLYALAFWLIAVYKQLGVTTRRLISRKVIMRKCCLILVLILNTVYAGKTPPFIPLIAPDAR